MGLPGHRRTSSHKHRRAAHFALTAKNVRLCPKCNKPSLPHRACASCGTYKGRNVTQSIVVKKINTVKKTKKVAA